MVFTVTLNPAIDRTLTLEEFKIDEVNRVITSRDDIGGKGINVSKVLQALGTPSAVMGFIGENHKEVFRSELDRHGIINNLIPIRGDTRTNIKIIDKVNATFTDLNEVGPVISNDELRRFLKLFEDMVKEEDIIVLSGRVPDGITQEIYGILTEKALGKGAYVIVDAEGESLKQVIKRKPHVIKPNEHEFYGLLGKVSLAEDEIIHEAVRLVESGIKKLLVSRGVQGSILVTEKHILVAESLKVEVKSTVGAGDAMVAALVHARVEGLDDLNTLALAQAAATAAVMTVGSKMPRLEEITLLLHETKRKIHEIHNL